MASDSRANSTAPRAGPAIPNSIQAYRSSSCVRKPGNTEHIIQTRASAVTLAIAIVIGPLGVAAATFRGVVGGFPVGNAPIRRRSGHQRLIVPAIALCIMPSF
jgi:hypothetical protein